MRNEIVVEQCIEFVKLAVVWKCYMIDISEALLSIFGVWVFKAVTTVLAVSGCDKCCCLLLRLSFLTQIGITCCQVLQEEGIFSLIVIQKQDWRICSTISVNDSLLLHVKNYLSWLCLHWNDWMEGKCRGGWTSTENIY